MILEYYRITADNRDLNYDNYFSKENLKESIRPINSNNANLLNIDQTKKFFNSPEIISDLK